MRPSILALTAGVCLLAAGTVFAEPGHPRPSDVELCHDYVRASHEGTGALQAGTSLADLVEASGCANKGAAECVVSYCYGSQAEATAAITRGAALSQK